MTHAAFSNSSQDGGEPVAESLESVTPTAGPGFVSVEHVSTTVSSALRVGDLPMRQLCCSLVDPEGSHTPP